MLFELIMLLGFFGAVLLSLLPPAATEAAKDSFRGRRPQRRSDRKHGGGRDTRCGRVTGRTETNRRRHLAGC